MSANCKWIEATTALASIIMALVSAFTLYVNVVERNEVVAIQKETARQTEQLSNMVAKVSLQRDVLAAAGGDRFAYKRARDLMFADKSCDDIPSLLKSMNFAMQRFWKDANENPIIKAEMLAPLSGSLDVVKSLSSENSQMRLLALHHVLDLRMNKYLPDIVEMLRNEPDLNVVQLAVKTINDTFSDNIKPNHTNPVWVFSLDGCVFSYDEFRAHFMEMWNAEKDVILGRKQKEVRSKADPKNPHLTLIYVFDPEN